MLKIENLSVSSNEGAQILKNLSLSVEPGEIHVIMGPNGAGKSTFAKALGGHPAYQVSSGKVEFQGEDLLELEPNERVHKGFFMSFQYPLEISGVSNFQLLHSAYNSLLKSKDLSTLSESEFEELLDEKMKSVQMKTEFKHRNVNEGFSGGEKKKMKSFRWQF